MGGRPPLLAVCESLGADPAEGDGAVLGLQPPVMGDLPPALLPAVPPPLCAAAGSFSPPPAAFSLLFCWPMMAWIYMDTCMSFPSLVTARSKAMASCDSFCSLLRG